MRKFFSSKKFASLTDEEQEAYLYGYFDDDEVMNETLKLMEVQLCSTSPDIFIIVKLFVVAILTNIFEKNGYEHPVDWHKEKIGIEHFSTNFFSMFLQVAIVSVQMGIEATPASFNVLSAISTVPENRRFEILELACHKFNTEMPTFEMLWEVLGDENLTCC
jgi:hypothetical protein